MNKLLLFFSGMITTAALNAQVICPGFTFTFTTTDASCANNNDGSVTAAATGGLAPYSYLWSASAGNQNSATANNLMPGTYDVYVSDMTGCIDTGTVTISYQLPEVPALCMVTCDANSINNFVYWDKTPYLNVDSFIIYREVSPMIYSRIGAVSADSLSEFEDTARNIGPANGDPNAASYRYKIQIRDTCGNYGLLSPYHSTIYITDNGLGMFSWTIPYTIEGAPNPVNNYILLCDTANVNVWGPVQTVSGTSMSAVDPAFSSHSNIANWRVKTAWNISCTPTRATVNTTRSNIKHASAVTTGLSDLAGSTMVIYPNPASSTITIALSPDIKKAELRIESILGQLIFEKHLEGSSIEEKIDLSHIPAGVYLVKIHAMGQETCKKLIVN